MGPTGQTSRYHTHPHPVRAPCRTWFGTPCRRCTEPRRHSPSCPSDDASQAANSWASASFSGRRRPQMAPRSPAHVRMCSVSIQIPECSDPCGAYTTSTNTTHAEQNRTGQDERTFRHRLKLCAVGLQPHGHRRRRRRVVVLGRAKEAPRPALPPCCRRGRVVGPRRQQLPDALQDRLATRDGRTGDEIEMSGRGRTYKVLTSDRPTCNLTSGVRALASRPGLRCAGPPAERMRPSSDSGA